VELLSERHPVYEDRPTYQIARIRGYALAAFESTGLPKSAVSFVLDELQNGRHAYMVAGAARGLRGSSRPEAAFVPLLLQAINNLRYHNDSLSLDVFKPSWPLENPTTALSEVFRTLQWLRGYAKGALPELKAFAADPQRFSPQLRAQLKAAIDEVEADNRMLDLGCCDIQNKEIHRAPRWLMGFRNLRSIEHLVVENQEGQHQPLGELIGRKPVVVAFFYTRCTNPKKCTLTINKMGWLQQELRQTGLDKSTNLIAFTYDPDFDTATRIRVFGENRGITFGPNVQMLRTRSEDFALLSDFFQLGVSHVGSTVNQHQLELFLLDHHGTIRTSYKRLQWQVEAVAKDVEKMSRNATRPGRFSSTMRMLQQVALPILLAVYPKCPACWAAYLSAFGITGIQGIPYSPSFALLIVAAMFINLWFVHRRAKRRNEFLPFWMSLIGGLLVFIPGYLFSHQTASLAGVFLVGIGAFLNSSPYTARQLSRVTRSRFSKLRRGENVRVLEG
jgi:protein SCO1/2